MFSPFDIGLKVFFKFLLTPLGLTWSLSITIMILGHFFNKIFNQQQNFFKTAPQIIQDCFLFGKTLKSLKTSSNLQFQVPKKWFTHFYLVSILSNGYLLWSCYKSYFLKRNVSEKLVKVVNWLTFNEYSSTPYFVTCSQSTTIIVLFCLTLQGFRRFYECMFISVFSNSTMHVFHYLAGLFFYSCQGITVLLGSRNLGHFSNFNYEFQNIQILGVILFLIFSLIQFWSHKKLANLRKYDQVKRNSHGLPNGGLFNLIAVPNMMAECGIYCSLFMVIKFNHFMFLLVALFVLTNQTLAALLTHQWYKNKFKNYPKNRYAIIPYLL